MKPNTSNNKPKIKKNWVGNIIFQRGYAKALDDVKKIIDNKIRFLDNQDTSKMTNRKYSVMNMLRLELLNVYKQITKLRKDNK